MTVTNKFSRRKAKLALTNWMKDLKTEMYQQLYAREIYPKNRSA